MYPDGEMTRLVAHKSALRARIARRRRRCAEACERLAQPLVLLERVHALGRKFAPLARALALPLGLFFARSTIPGQGWFARVLRWSPVALTVWRGLTAPRRDSR
jgi:hypothetical protein